MPPSMTPVITPTVCASNLGASDRRQVLWLLWPFRGRAFALVARPNALRRHRHPTGMASGKLAFSEHEPDHPGLDLGARALVPRRAARAAESPRHAAHAAYPAGHHSAALRAACVGPGLPHVPRNDGSVGFRARAFRYHWPLPRNGSRFAHRRYGLLAGLGGV